MENILTVSNTIGQKANNAEFAKPDSIVRKIWGTSDTIMVIFACAAAEFALSKAVDWLYFTGKLPKDPLGRLFSTVAYARRIVFAKVDRALQAIDSITAIHRHVEGARGFSIPDWAYRDVLFMLIDYSIRSYELLYNKMQQEEKEEVFDVFYRVGHRMQINGLPDNFSDWTTMRKSHLEQNLQYSHFTTDLFKQYEKHLGKFRYRLLVNLQANSLPDEAMNHLQFKRTIFFHLAVKAYRFSRNFGLDKLLQKLLIPKQYRKEISSWEIK